MIAQSEWDPELAKGGIPTKPHSQAGIKQRWGRVGRKAPGLGVPALHQGPVPGAGRGHAARSARENLEALVMTAKMGGIDDVVGFPWPAAFQPDDHRTRRRCPRRPRGVPRASWPVPTGRCGRAVPSTATATRPRSARS